MADINDLPDAPVAGVTTGHADDHADIHDFLEGRKSPTGNIAMGTRKVTGLGDPTDPQDAATRAYVLANSETDHGGLTGLADDDHTQYLTEARHDALAADNPHSVTLTQAVTADAGTNATAAEIEELTDGSTTTLHAHTATSDHGALTGLADDDHTQYHTAARHASVDHTGFTGIGSDGSDHTIASHSDTTATGAELEELTDGSTTTLHGHAGIDNDHGTLTGLADDDHTQYLTTARHTALDHADLDTDAIHKDIAGEIVGITEKSTPAANDVFLIEDSAAANAKARVTYANLGIATGSVTPAFVDISVSPYSVDMSGSNSSAIRQANTVGFQKAINEAKSTGRAIYIPEGTFYTDNSLATDTYADQVYGNISAETWHSTYKTHVFLWSGVTIIGGASSASRAGVKPQWYADTVSGSAEPDWAMGMVVSGNKSAGPLAADDSNMQLRDIFFSGQQKVGYNIVWVGAADSLSGIYRAGLGGVCRSGIYYCSGPTNFVMRDTRADAWNEWAVDFGSRGDITSGLAQQRIGFGPKNFLWDGMTIDAKNGSYANTSLHNYYGVIYAGEVRNDGTGPASSYAAGAKNAEGLQFSIQNLNIETNSNYNQGAGGAEPYYSDGTKDAKGSLFTFQLNEETGASQVPYSVRINFHNIFMKGPDSGGDNHNLVRLRGTSDADDCLKAMVSFTGTNELKMEGQVLVGADGTTNTVPAGFTSTANTAYPEKLRQIYGNYAWAGHGNVYGIN